MVVIHYIDRHSLCRNCYVPVCWHSLNLHDAHVQFLVSHYNLSGTALKHFQSSFFQIIITLTTYFLDKLIFKLSVVSEWIIHRTRFEEVNGHFDEPKAELVAEKRICTKHLSEYKAFIPLN